MCQADNGVTHLIANKHRLSENVTPIHYAFTLRPDLKAFTFAGGEVIDIRVHKPTKVIALNAVELDITSASVTNAEGCRLVAAISYDTEHEQALFSFDGVVGKGKWQLHITFNGEINDKLHGFYRSY